MTTSWLASIENKPQDQQQLHGGKNVGQIKSCTWPLGDSMGKVWGKNYQIFFGFLT